MKQLNAIGSSAATMEAQRTRTAGKAQGATATDSRTTLEVAVSVAASAQLSTTSLLIQQNAGAEDVRYAKVASLKAAIDAGKYRIPASAVAGKLMVSMLG